MTPKIQTLNRENLKKSGKKENQSGEVGPEKPLMKMMYHPQKDTKREVK